MTRRVLAWVALLAVVGALLFALLRERTEPTEPTEEQRPSASPGREDDRARPPRGAPELAHAVDDVPQDCTGALAVPEGGSALMRQQRRLRIEGFLDGQEGALRRELIADLAGYRPKRETVFGSGLSGAMFWRYAPPATPGERRLSYAEFEELEEVRQRDGIGGLFELADASLLQAAWGVTTYAGHLIQEHGEAFHAALPTSRGAFALGLHELAVAIRAGVGEAAFAALLALAPVDARAAWHNGVNLAKVAAIHNRPRILRGLVARGVDPAAAPLWPTGRSVLDDIASRPRPAGPGGAEALAEVVWLLTAAGDRPYLPGTLSTLAQWLPNASLPALHPEAEALVASLSDAAATVAAMDAEWTAKADAAARLERRCQGEAVAATGEFAQGLPPDAGLPPGSGLAAKQRQQQAFAAQAERGMEKKKLARTRAQAEGEHIGEDDPLPAAPPAAQRARDALSRAVLDDRWDDAIAAADQLGGHAPMLLLHMALGSDAPLEALLALLDRNAGRLPQNAVELLVLSRRADAAEIAAALAPFDLDLNYVDPRGRNAFGLLATTTLQSDGAWRFADYLASRFVSVKPSAWGLDPLDMVLMRLVEYPRASGARIRFARFLVDHGAPVEASHLELAAQLALRSEDAHRRLLDAVPELAS